MKAWGQTMIIAAGAALILAGCGSQNSEEAAAGQGDKLKVVTTFYPMYEFTKQVAGDLADVEALVPAGVEPHDWEPSAKDMAKLKEADLFVYNGVVESWVEDALTSAANDSRIVVEASSGITLLPAAESEEEEHEAEEAGHEEEGEDHDHDSEHSHEHDHGGVDPHVWLDPVMAQKEVEAILVGFEAADPANKKTYEANAKAYIAKLQELDQSFREGLADVGQKEFVTQHAAFGYLAAQYGLTQVPIAGLSPDQEPSPNQMADIVEFAKAHKVTTVFFETLADPKVAKVVADELDAKTAVLNPLEGLTNEERESNLDYIGVMKNNLEALKQALQ